ncbi:MAG: sigma-70 family RNA polymerase sigma factor [Coriobacteriales bacterium]|jgi:RNA polymerase sigma-70 factor (ECF subfamily)|nr:sigma-70 family RNA polymerase sigma factor [Coriobacteriales bacterium]
MNTIAAEPLLDTTEVINRYKDMVYGIALTHTRNRSDAEDVFQDVFLVYHRKQPPCGDEERLKAWLITTTLYCAKQLITSSWRRKVVLLHEYPTEASSEEGFHFRTDEQDSVFSALQELPRAYRTVLHLFYFEDMPLAQIALALDIKLGTVKARLSRGRSLMRDRLKGEYFYA